MPKGSLLPADTAPTTDDYLIGIDMAGPTTKKIALSTLFLMLHPIGEIYINVTGTNPGTQFGGTWSAWGTGRVPVGVDTSDTDFATAEATSGAKTVALSGNQNGVHNHGVNDPGHSHSFNIPTYVANGGSGLGYPGGGSTWHYQDGPYGTNGSGTGVSIQNSGSGDPHNNVQPSIAVFMWKRTA